MQKRRKLLHVFVLPLNSAACILYEKMIIKQFFRKSLRRKTADILLLGIPYYAVQCLRKPPESA